MAEVTLKNITKIYGKDVVAVQNIDLLIEDNEFVVLVGPSGCGKSTTLRMIAGLEEISDGELYIDDVLVNDVLPKNRDIAMVFQNYALYPHMTVYNNMAFGLKLRKFKKAEIEKLVNEAAQLLGIVDLLKRQPKALSGGQRQRVALGRAIVRDPKVFLMDEPLSNLDAKLRVQMRGEIQKLHRRLDATTIYVTHDQTEAMTMATLLVVMNDGIVQQIGKPKDVYDFPVNMFVGSFIGSPSMNFLQGNLVDGHFHIGNSSVKIPGDKLKTLLDQGYDNKELILGVRPEDIYESTNYPEFTNTMLEVQVDVTELMGSETVVYGLMDNQNIVSRIDARSGIINDSKLSLSLDMNVVHFFDKDSEFRIIDK